MKIFRTERIKSYSCSIILVSAFFFTAAPLYSESFFLKDGSITDGEIIREDDTEITLKITSGETKRILRQDLIRVLVHKRYLDKKYITKTGGITIYGYIVNEDNDAYTLRKTLDSPEEIKIPRDEVETISVKPASERQNPPSVYSSVFTRDGSIIDCRVIKESTRSIEVQPASGESRVIPINDIIRIQYNTNYKEKKILGKTDGTKIEAYIMEENLDNYVYRIELSSPSEFRISKNELKSISKR